MHAEDMPLAFVQVSQQVGVEVQGPETIGNLLEADMLTNQRRGDGDVAAMKAHAAIIAHVARDLVLRILRAGNAQRERAARWAVDRAGWLPA